MIKKIFYIILMLVASRAGATNLLLAVKDKNTNEILSGASYELTFQNGTKKTGITNEKGEIEIKDVQYPINLICTYISYRSGNETIQKKSVRSKKGTDVYTIYLEPSATNIGELIVTGQAVPVMAKQSLYKVNAISAAEITKRGAVTLNDLLNYEMNNFVSNDNILGSSVNVGGIGGQNVKVLVNGIPVMGRENGNIDMGQFNLNNIKRVEMIQGPMSVIYGSNALGGVINLITATKPNKFSVGLRSYSESIGRYNFSGNVGFNKKNQQLQLSIARNFFAGWTPKDSIDRFQLWKPKTQYTADLQYLLNIKKVKLNYFASYLNEKITNKGEPIINPYEGYAFDEYYRTNRIIQSLSANSYIRKNTDQITFTNSFQTYKRTKNRLKKDLVTLVELQTQNVGDQDTTRFNDFNSRGVYSTNRFKNFDAMLGYEYAYESGVSYKLADQHQTMSEIGVFASGVYKIKAFQIQPSFRMTYNNLYKKAFTPALHTKYDLNEKTQLRVSYARGFRAPTLKELYLQFIDQNHTIIGNPELKPEIGDHYEIGLEHQKQIKNLTVGYIVNGYYNAIQNLIALAVFNNHGVLRQYDNIEDYKNWVFNVKGKFSSPRLNVSAGGGIIFVEKSTVTPSHTIFEGTFSGSYLFKQIGTSVNVNYKYNSRQPVITVDQQFLYTSPLHIANLSLQKSFFQKKLQLQFGVKNLLNIQNANLTGSINTQTTGHSSASSMQVFPARSLFVDLSYSL